MADNRLYQLLQSNKPSFITDNELKHKFSKFHESNYVMYHLPKSFISLTDDAMNVLTLESHHLSFYQSVTKSNPYLSEYHYTAHFRDTNNNLYELHVYFNERDQLTTMPLLKLIQDGENITQPVSADFSHILTEFALIQTANSMKKLREYQSNQIDLALKEYHASEQKLATLSININENLDAYLNQVDVVITHLKKLIPLQDNPLYNGILKKIEVIRNLCLSQQASSEDAEETQDEEIDILNTDIMPSIASQHLLPAQPVKTKVVASLNEAIQASDGYYALKSKQANLLEKINAFLKLHEVLNEITTGAENDYHVVKVADMAWCQTQLAKEQQEGTALLKEALVFKNYQAAQSLLKYAPSLPNDLIGMAVSTNNAKMLDFLLTHRSIPINTFVVIDDLTLVQFCLERSTREASKKEVFDVLIKHGASLLQPAQDGLPVAHHILSKGFEHSLYLSLSKFITSQKFWQSLENTLRHYLMTNPALSEQQKTELETQISLYCKSENLAKGDKSKIHALQIENILKGKNKIGDHYTEDQLARLKSDPDIIKLLEKHNELHTKIYKMCTLHEQRDMNKRSVATLSHIDNMNKLVDIKNMPFSIIKQRFVDYTTNLIKQYELGIELKTIQKVQSHPSRKAQQKSIKRQEKICSEIRALRKEVASYDSDTSYNSDTSTGRMLSQLSSAPNSNKIPTPTPLSLEDDNLDMADVDLSQVEADFAAMAKEAEKLLENSKHKPAVQLTKKEEKKQNKKLAKRK